MIQPCTCITQPLSYLIIKAGQEALKLAVVLALPSPLLVTLVLISPLAIKESLGQAELRIRRLSQTEV